MRRRAHPRSRGENSHGNRIGHMQSGSSPLTRGKPEHAGRNQRRRGLIPAHAGITSRSEFLGRQAGAHPRSRGENLHAQIPADYQPGSSPLTRGKPLSHVAGDHVLRLIPAHAGKTERRRRTLRSRRAHPRSRGENTRKMGLAAIVAGSSPLTRGKPNRGRHRPVRARLIPAQAGKTWCASARPQRSRAHPR